MIFLAILLTIFNHGIAVTPPIQFSVGGRLTDYAIISDKIFAEFSESFRYGTLFVD